MKLLKKFPQTPILVIGDLMLDKFIWGDISRISPEAPVPVFVTTRETFAPGGSGNVVNNLSALEAEVFAAGVVGDDAQGQMLINTFKDTSVHTNGIFVDQARPTTSKTRIIARNQQVLRMDIEESKKLNQQSAQFLNEYITRTIPVCKAVIISDYGKGVIDKKLLKKTISLAHKYKIPVTVDPKIEHFKQYKGITCMTPNLQEAVTGMHWFKVDTDDELNKLGKSILKTLRCKSVLITRGNKGMNLFEQNKTAVYMPITTREVFDVTGAGDTVISVLSLALACGASLSAAARISNYAAGLVVGKVGTATVSLSELNNSSVLKSL